MSDDAEDAPADTGSTSATPGHSARGSRKAKRRARAKARHTVAKVVLASLVTVGMVTGLGVVYLYRHFDDQLNTVNLDGQLKNRPDKKHVDTGPKEPLNILVMGSDTRDGQGNNIDNLTGGGARSDTTIMFHLSADRENAYGISIPRDTLVDRPDCYAKNGDVIPGATDAMWNEAYSVGGPACTMQQFEQITGIRLDHYVVLDFGGFQDMVDAIDGVEVCIPEDISDPAHGIDIPAGTREIEGKEALNYVRARYTLGDGSDIGRIKRQQAFIAAMATKVLSKGTLARVDRLLGFLDAAISSLQTDIESPLKIAKIGVEFKHIGLDNIKFVTAPFQYSTAQPGRVELLPEAQQLWNRVISDEPLTKRQQDGVITAGDNVEGSGPGGPGSTQSPGGSETPEQADEREAAGLCA